MRHRLNKVLAFLVLIGFMHGGVLAFAASRHDQRPEQSTHQQVEGIDIYYGIVPSSLVSKHPAAHEERKMHGGSRASKDDYHLIVALFDSNGSRINSASVEATVEELGMAGTKKPLEPMSIAGTTSFGNYFSLHRGRIYRISVKLKRLDKRNSPAVEALFEYRLQ